MTKEHNTFTLLDHLYEMQDTLLGKTAYNKEGGHWPSAYDVTRLIGAALEIPKFTSIINPQLLALQLGRLFYAVQTPHSELDFRYMEENDTDALIQQMNIVLTNWIAAFERQMDVKTELPKAPRQYHEDELTWAGPRSKVWSSLPEILTTPDKYSGKTTQYLVLPGLFALSHSKYGAELTELVSGKGLSLGKSKDITKEQCKLFLLRFAGELDWATWVGWVNSQETIYIRREVRKAMQKINGWDYVNQFKQEWKNA